MGHMEQSDPEVVDAALSMTLAVAAGDDEAVEVLMRAHDPADLAIAGARVIWRMASALGQLVDPKRSPPQMIHVFSQAMRDDGTGDMSG
jgi:hypothetical protein